jgi:hypothetical protein
VRAHVAAGLAPAFDKDINAGCGSAQATASGGLGRALLAADDLGAMFWKLDLLAMTKGAEMLGNDGGTIEQSDSAVVGDQCPSCPSRATVIWCRTLIICRARWSDSPSIDGVETICERALRFAHLARGRAE